MGRMRRPDAVLFLTIAVLTLVGCGSAQQNARTGSVRKVQQVAQVYDVHDGRESRKRTKFRQVLGHFPTGVTVVAGMDGDEPIGLAVGSFFSLSLGVDYTIFFHSEEGAGSADEPRDHVLHAMAVALGSTLLSLGILVLSETPAVRSFGLVLSAGVLFAFLLAPATRLITRRNTYREERPR